MLCYKEMKGPANPGILVISGCHPNHLGHAAICGLPLMALGASTFYN